MKRDMKLVFEILVFIETTVTDLGPAHFEIAQEIGTNRSVWDNSDAEEELMLDLAYHLDLLEGGGKIVKYVREPHGDQPDETFYQLTWDGHDLLDSMRKVINIR